MGRLSDASNATFLCRLGDAEAGPLCVYKPVKGERPLDDFPSHTLARREVAAHLLSEVAGWRIVPPTILRDGPFGAGMAQAWIEPDPEIDVVELVLRADERLRRICLFDALANNADRKGGHLLATDAGHVWGVDHGICFAVEPKLRTVLWQWRGEALDEAEIGVVRRVRSDLDGALGAALGDLLSAAEVAASVRRADALLADGRFPMPDPLRPAVPWPPY
ncbi:SCO1664 family protein [soil metagenome]